MKLSGIVFGTVLGIIMWTVTQQVIWLPVGVALGVAFDSATTKKK